MEAKKEKKEVGIFDIFLGTMVFLCICFFSMVNENTVTLKQLLIAVFVMTISTYYLHKKWR
jgi:L-lysine 2,3-aminomutase